MLFITQPCHLGSVKGTAELSQLSGGFLVAGCRCAGSGLFPGLALTVLGDGACDRGGSGDEFRKNWLFVAGAERKVPCEIKQPQKRTECHHVVKPGSWGCGERLRLLGGRSAVSEGGSWFERLQGPLSASTLAVLVGFNLFLSVLRQPAKEMLQSRLYFPVAVAAPVAWLQCRKQQRVGLCGGFGVWGWVLVLSVALVGFDRGLNFKGAGFELHR